uniref:Putative secreted protein n=1 Tax=Ixodes ricinus TaxID=34613 RepID=A0A6B0UTN7_IXORI
MHYIDSVLKVVLSILTCFAGVHHWSRQENEALHAVSCHYWKELRRGPACHRFPAGDGDQEGGDACWLAEGHPVHGPAFGDRGRDSQAVPDGHQAVRSSVWQELPPNNHGLNAALTGCSPQQVSYSRFYFSTKYLRVQHFGTR